MFASILGSYKQHITAIDSTMERMLLKEPSMSKLGIAIADEIDNYFLQKVQTCGILPAYSLVLAMVGKRCSHCIAFLCCDSN